MIEDPFDIVDARTRATRANLDGDGDQGAFVLVGSPERE